MVEERGIASSSQAGFFHIQDIDRWFARTQTHDDIDINILIRQKADPHGRFEPT